MKTVYCPVWGRQVNGTECFEMVLVADGMVNAKILSPDVTWSEQQRQICLRCYYHADLDRRSQNSIALTQQQEQALAEHNIPVFENTEETLKVLKERAQREQGREHRCIQRLYDEIRAQNEQG